MFQKALYKHKHNILTVAFYGSVSNFTNFCYSVSSVNFCQYKIPANKDTPGTLNLKHKSSSRQTFCVVYQIRMFQNV